MSKPFEVGDLVEVVDTRTNAGKVHIGKRFCIRTFFKTRVVAPFKSVKRGRENALAMFAPEHLRKIKGSSDLDQEFCSFYKKLNLEDFDCDYFGEESILEKHEGDDHESS